jgi:hypothetical protein
MPEWFSRLLPFFIPIVLIQVSLQIYCLVDLYRQEQVRGPKWVWAIVIPLFQFFGVIIYLTLGRREG